MSCEYCKSSIVNKDYPVRLCSNGDLGARANMMHGSIILWVDRHIASGYIDINYCPMCGREITAEGQVR